MTNKQQLLRLLERYISRLDRTTTRLKSRSRLFSRIRLGLVVGGTALSVCFYQLDQSTLSLFFLLLTLASFIILAVYHEKTHVSLQKHELWKDIKSNHIYRMRLDWESLPPPQSIPMIKDHPFQNDLNLSGPRSIHHLVNTAITSKGGERLASWLLDPEPIYEEILTRQKLLRELKRRTLFRDRITLNGMLSTQGTLRGTGGDHLLDWLNREKAPVDIYSTLWVLAGLSVLNWTLVALDLFGVLPNLWVISFLAYFVFYYFKHPSFGETFNSSFSIQRDLKQFRAVWGYIESYRYGSASYLSDLCKPFWNSKTRPSKHLRRVERIETLSSLQLGIQGLIGVILNIMVPWDLFCTYLLERAKKDMRDFLPMWLDLWYEIEALCSMATFANLNPDYTPAKLVQSASASKPLFKGSELGHPLIPDHQKVRNDFTMTTLGQVVIITGSNMSGKSTFLRTLGVNLRLAYCGCPVDAKYIQANLFRIFCSLQVNDSIQDGISFFYAEVRRLKALLHAFQEPHSYPLFFLIDEIFRGTNNKERLIGSRSYIQSLVNGHGVGLVATHDLELVHLEDEFPSVSNYHFREEIRDATMIFDYRLHSGPCPTTNALKIMKMEGLPIGEI